MPSNIISVSSSWTQIFSTNTNEGYFAITFEELTGNTSMGTIQFAELRNINDGTEIHTTSDRGVNKLGRTLPTTFNFDTLPNQVYELRRNTDKFLEIRLISGTNVQMKATINIDTPTWQDDKTIINFCASKNSNTCVEYYYVQTLNSDTTTYSSPICYFTYQGATGKVPKKMEILWAVSSITGNPTYTFRLRNTTGNTVMTTVSSSTPSGANTLTATSTVSFSNVPVSDVICAIDYKNNVSLSSREIRIYSIQITF